MSVTDYAISIGVFGTLIQILSQYSAYIVHSAVSSRNADDQMAVALATAVFGTVLWKHCHSKTFHRMCAWGNRGVNLVGVSRFCVGAFTFIADPEPFVDFARRVAKSLPKAAPGRLV